MLEPDREVPSTIRRNLLDKQFGEWKVIGFAGRKRTTIRWLCRCSCGRVKEVSTGNLMSGLSTQCASCANRKHPVSNFKHGYSETKTYKVWRGAITSGQCVARWQVFLNFLEDMGYRPEGHRLRRIDPSQPYGPTNCRWEPRRREVNKELVRQLEQAGDRAERRRLIQQLRQDGYTYQEIANVAGVTRETIRQVLSGPQPKWVTGEPRWKSTPEERRRIEEQIIAQYNEAPTIQDLAAAIDVPYTAVRYCIARLVRLGKLSPRRPPRVVKAEQRSIASASG